MEKGARSEVFADMWEARARMLAEINTKIDGRVFVLYNLSSSDAKNVAGQK